MVRLKDKSFDILMMVLFGFIRSILDKMLLVFGPGSFFCYFEYLSALHCAPLKSLNLESRVQKNESIGETKVHIGL